MLPIQEKNDPETNELHKLLTSWPSASHLSSTLKWRGLSISLMWRRRRVTNRLDCKALGTVIAIGALLSVPAKALRTPLALFELSSTPWLFWCPSVLVTKTKKQVRILLAFSQVPAWRPGNTLDTGTSLCSPPRSPKHLADKALPLLPFHSRLHLNQNHNWTKITEKDLKNTIHLILTNNLLISHSFTKCPHYKSDWLLTSA